jgi:hypothetical protein
MYTPGKIGLGFSPLVMVVENLWYVIPLIKYWEESENNTN